MRDLALILGLLCSIPYIFKRPYIGAIVLAVVGFLNPQTMTWGLARTVPFVAIAFAVTAVAMTLNAKDLKFELNNTFKWVIVFLFWGAICTLNALFPEDAKHELIRFFKIQVVIFMTLMLITDKQKLHHLVWAIALSLGFWGIKGGIFSLATAGAYRIWGPDGTFIGGNNEIGLALLMNIPLLYYLFTQSSHKWVKRGLAASIFFCFLAVLFTYSRGAFLGMIATSFFLWWKSSKKLPLAAIGIVITLVAIPFIPQELFDRLNTIESYEQDKSAMGRINAWTVAIRVANDRITGGGFRHWGEYTFALYSDNPEDIHDAHSIYFEVLGEMGWPGLFIFLLIHFLTWRNASKIISNCKNKPNLVWASELAKMIQVSLIAYYSGSAFLGLAYWDFPYYLMLIILLVQRTIAPQLAQDELEQKKLKFSQSNNAYSSGNQ